MRRFLLSVAPLLCCCFMGLAHAQCPPDSVQCLIGPPREYLEPGHSCIGPWDATQGCIGACYDLRQGELGILEGGTPLGWHNQVLTDDEYWLDGPASPSGVTFYARLHIKGTIQNGNDGEAGIGEGVSITDKFVFSGADSPLDDFVILPLTHVPGERFHLRARLDVAGVGGPSVDVRARIEFVDVPTGWTVASCQGYSLPVPTAHSTWGELKARYR